MEAWDLDGTLTGTPPSGACVISGRTFSEYDDLAKSIAGQLPLYIRGSGRPGDRQDAGEFKALMINRLGVTLYHEDDPIQAEIIQRSCPNCTVTL